MAVGTGAARLVELFAVSWHASASSYVGSRGLPWSVPFRSAPAVYPPRVPATVGVVTGGNVRVVPTRGHKTVVQHGKSVTVVSVLRDYSIIFVGPVSTIGTRPTHPTGGETIAAKPDSLGDSGRADYPGLISTP